jgi:hypothetical protein
MRKLVLLLTLCAAPLAASPARAQVSDAERAAARQLFKEGDDLQREGKFPEALDKFQRAQQVFSAPTNMLRIAECQAALGRLVESSESYHAVVRTPLPAGSPPAFQAAVDQAKAELSQVEPRVPKVTVQVQPAGASGLQLQIDGQSVPAALIGEAIPLDPGTHKVMVLASGYVSSEQAVPLKERETRTVAVVLKPLASVTYAPGNPPGAAPPPPAPGGAPPPAPAPYVGAGQAPGNVPPTPPQMEGPSPQPMPKQSKMGFLFGGHLGWQAPLLKLPIDSATTVDANNVSGGGFTYAVDGGLRFARHWYLGLSLEHATLAQGQNVGALGGSVASVSSDTTLLALILAIMGNPDRTSGYFEIGLANRWYGFTASDGMGNKVVANNYSSGEFLLGLGMWVPAGSSLRFLPEVTLGLGSFSSPSGNTSTSSSTSSNSTGNAFVMLGLAGFYNLDF